MVPRTAAGIDVTLPSYLRDVWHVPTPAGPAPAGLVITVMGAYVPARRGARLTLAEVLHGE
ncbi:hypothetical protein ACFQ9Z_02035 [Streptomyces sp. NPDC056580]|uniref:hypothetical protein n=1 Tax=Streptomyces sp. NPDC056580 TaxID=3345872 RepID=UPI00367FD004